jgi:SAM-dependent methyltransferase
VFLSGTEFRTELGSLYAAPEQLLSYHQARRHSALNVRYYDHWVARLLAELPPGPVDLVLELMCGEAEVCRRLPSRVRSAFAIDINPQMVQWAQEGLAQLGEQRVGVACASAARLPLPDACANAVFIQGGLHHARPLLAEVLAEVARVLKPGGVLIGSEPANDHFLTRAVRHWQYARSRFQGNDPDEDGFTRSELASVLGPAGLRLDRYRQFGFVAYPLIGNTDLVPLLARSRSRALGSTLLAIDWALERVPVVRRLAWASLYRAFKDGAP